MYGAVGHDAFAEPALALLAAGGVDLNGVLRVDAPTGCATILVDAYGENCIAVAPGANALARADAVPDDALGSDTVVVLQQEVSAEANAALIARARRRGARIILNAAPARPLSLDVLRKIDVLVVNETEAAALAPDYGWPAAPEAFAGAAIGALTSVSAIVLTLGKEGALAAFGGELLRVPALEVSIVDTTGAGDAFVGALAAALDAATPLPEALRFAVAAGSLACTAAGAQTALPDRAAIEAALG
jgi:ribokinase